MIYAFVQVTLKKAIILGLRTRIIDRKCANLLPETKLTIE